MRTVTSFFCKADPCLNQTPPIVKLGLGVFRRPQWSFTLCQALILVVSANLGSEILLSKQPRGAQFGSSRKI